MTSVDFSSYKPTAHTSNAAAPLDNFMDALQSLLNGGLDDANILAAALSPNRLKQGGATVGQVLVWNGSAWAPGSGVTAPLKKTTAKDINTTTTETDLLNGEFTVSAGTLGTTGVLKLHAAGDALYNAAGGPPRFKLKLGGTVLLDTGVPAQNVNTSATRFGWRIDARICNLGATNAQAVEMNGEITTLNGLAAQAKAAFATGEGNYLGDTGIAGSLIRFFGVNTTAIDTTGANLLELTVINGVSSASYSVKLFSAAAEFA